MPPSLLPLISEADYPRFQQLIPELLKVDYHEWHDDHLKAVAYRDSRNGSREVAISPDEFAGWLRENGLKAHLELLWVCIEEKARAVMRPARLVS